MAIIKSKKVKTAEKRTYGKPVDESVSDDAMERLAKIMNDSPTLVKLHGTEWEIHALKAGTQYLICEEACKIVKDERMSMGDVIKQFAVSLPSVCRCITLALLNDKEKINDKELFQRVYDTLMWGDYDMKDWMTLLYEIINLINVDFFFASTNVIQTIRLQSLERKKMVNELKR